MIRIKDPNRAIISAPHEPELSDEERLKFAVWLLSRVARRLDVDEVELTYEPGESDQN